MLLTLSAWSLDPFYGALPENLTSVDRRGPIETLIAAPGSHPPVRRRMSLSGYSATASKVAAQAAPDRPTGPDDSRARRLNDVDSFLSDGTARSHEPTWVQPAVTGPGVHCKRGLMCNRRRFRRCRRDIAGTYQRNTRPLCSNSASTRDKPSQPQTKELRPEKGWREP
jgi:hypothetical protein